MTDPTLPLSPQQALALRTIAEWWNNGDPQTPVFRLFGFAGTGKTTIAKRIHSFLGDPLLELEFCAYTGKAASVLRAKGCEPASTIHSLIYQPAEKSRLELRDARRQLAICLDPAERLRLEALVEQLTEDLEKPSFIKRPGALDGIDLLVIDEVSMIDDQMGADLLSFDTPLLVLGDPAQLPPVSGNAPYGFFMRDPADILLTEIHRQVANSPVLELATRVREGRGTRPGDYIQHQVPLARAAGDSAQVLVGRNATRWTLNTRIRQALGRQAGRPEPGDRIVCLTNNRELDIFNGQVFTVLDVRPVPKDPYVIDLRLAQLMPEPPEPEWVRASILGFIDEETEREARRQAFRWKDKGFFTWAYALTTHKAQGSQWEHVFVVDESGCFREDAVRWLYTGVTRASHTVTLGTADNFT